MGVRTGVADGSLAPARAGVNPVPSGGAPVRNVDALDKTRTHYPIRPECRNVDPIRLRAHNWKMKAAAMRTIPKKIMCALVIPCGDAAPVLRVGIRLIAYIQKISRFGGFRVEPHLPMMEIAYVRRLDIAEFPVLPDRPKP